MNHVVVAIISQPRSPGLNEYLLMSAQKNFGKFTGFYYPPGGHLEDGETEQIALKRELKEELNLDITPIKKLSQAADDVPDRIIHWWKCIAHNKAIILQTDEVKDIKWFTKQEILKSPEIWPATKQFFTKLAE